MASARYNVLQHRVWRWHFFAGLMVIPFAIILAFTGSIYLFKAQYHAAVDKHVAANATADTGPVLPADELVDAAMSAHEGAQFKKITLPMQANDRTLEVELVANDTPRTLWIDIHSADILHDVATSDRLMGFVQRIHGTLLNGDIGSYIVELMACWMIILIVTGTYLWWPRDKAWWRVFLPSFGDKGPKRGLWRNLHGMTGAWIGVVVLCLLISGLPWTQVWGDGFSRAQKLFGLTSPGQEWFVTLQSEKPKTIKEDGLNLWTTGEGTEGVVTLESEKPSTGLQPITLQDVVDKVVPQKLHPPIEIQPPRGDNGVWTVRSMVQNRPLRETVHYDKWSGNEIMRITFSDYNPMVKAASYGIAFHEGALFGPVNQGVGVLAAIGVVFLSVSGAILWWKRRPSGAMGVPPIPADKRVKFGVVLLVIILGVFLPLSGLSLVAFLILDFLWGKVTRRARST